LLHPHRAHVCRRIGGAEVALTHLQEDHPIQPEYTIDSCGLIDLVDEDPSLLRRVVATLGVVIVTTTVLAEVDGLTRDDAEGLGLQIHDPSDDEFEAAIGRGTSLSFADRVCLVVAQRGSLVCITGDNQLARECKQGGLGHWPTLQPLVELVRHGVLSHADCLVAARSIRDRNRCITTQVFQRFEVQLKTASRRARRG
jgi:hypothetical protein